MQRPFLLSRFMMSCHRPCCAERSERVMKRKALRRALGDDEVSRVSTKTIHDSTNYHAAGDGFTTRRHPGIAPIPLSLLALLSASVSRNKIGAWTMKTNARHGWPSRCIFRCLSWRCDGILSKRTVAKDVVIIREPLGRSNKVTMKSTSTNIE